jgi:hypothetical protein
MYDITSCVIQQYDSFDTTCHVVNHSCLQIVYGLMTLRYKPKHVAVCPL